MSTETPARATQPHARGTHGRHGLPTEPGPADDGDTPASPRHRNAAHPSLVFCDVDETLIRCKSAVEFLPHYFERHHGPDGARRAAELLADLTGRVARGMPREEANRLYHRAWRGCPVAQVEAEARRWYRQRSRSAGFYIPATLAALRSHQAEGTPVALVSGSFPPLLSAVAEVLGARYALGARLERCGPVLTGELIGAPAIGEGKRTLVRQLLARHPHIDPADCWAYGDHPSDLPMLHTVGHAVMVAADGSHAPVRQPAPTSPVHA
ncbi:HAD family hydrolase [Streptomyces sp. NPDC092370]|uniref:HAD family hydrolase n=1 Tax=Streptomyces sp. NPDC092370 TaxID=3366016 RepID=UPI0037F62CA3